MPTVSAQQEPVRLANGSQPDSKIRARITLHTPPSQPTRGMDSLVAKAVRETATSLVSVAPPSQPPQTSKTYKSLLVFVCVFALRSDWTDRGAPWLKGGNGKSVPHGTRLGAVWTIHDPLVTCFICSTA